MTDKRIDQRQLLWPHVPFWNRLARRAADSDVRSIIRLVITTAIFAAALWLMEAGRTTLAFVAFAWSFSRYVRQSIGIVLLGPMRILLDVVTASRCNAKVQVDLNIREIVKHEVMQRVFDRLKAAGRIAADVEWSNWQGSILKTFLHESGLPESDPGYGYERLQFQFRGGQLFKNDEWQASPFIHHELILSREVVVNDASGAGPFRKDFLPLRLRLVVVNGVMKIQLGQWDAVTSTTPTSADWIAWDTVTSFPLLFNPLNYHLPPRVLLLDGFDGTSTSDKENRQMAHTFRSFVEDYWQVLATGNGYASRRAERRLTTAFDAWLQREHFRTDNRSFWANDLLYVGVSGLQEDSGAYHHLSDIRGRFGQL